MRPATVLELALENHVELPGVVEAGLHDRFTFTSFEQFIQTYIAVTRCLRRAADYERIVVELAQDLARQGVGYAEVTCSPSTPVLYLGLSETAFVDGLTRGRT